MTKIAKKYRDTAINPWYSEKKKLEKAIIIGSLALQGTKGVRTIVIFLSASSSIVLQDIIHGTLHPEPTIKGINDLPLKPNFLNNLSRKKAILDI